MGCGISKVGDSELVSLCRERKKLIKAAVDCRYALASAHISYFQSLLDLGNALNRFVEEELVSSVDPLSNAVPDHQSLGEGSESELLSTDSDPEVISLTDEVHGGSEVAEHSTPESESGPGVHVNVHYMQRSSEEVPTMFYEQPQAVPTRLQWQGSSKPLGQYSQYGNSMNFPVNYHRFSQYGNGATLIGPISFPPNNLRFLQYENGASFGGPMNLPPDRYGADLPTIDPRFPHYKNGPSGVSMYPSSDGPYYNKTYFPPTAPPVPPPPEASDWDYLNPFNVVEDTYRRYYSHGGPEIAFGPGINDPDLREERMREGIPDLEDDTEQNLMEEETNDSDLEEVRMKEGIPELEDDTKQNLTEEAPNDIALDLKTKGVSGEGSSEVVSPKNEDHVPLAQGKETRSNNDRPIADLNVIKTTLDAIEEDTRREPETIVPEGLEEEERENRETTPVQKSTEEVESSEQVSSLTLFSPGSRELQEVLKEIKDAFEAASNHGKEVSVMLEAGKLPYQPRAFSSWILMLVAPSLVKSSCPLHTKLKRSASITGKVAKVNTGTLERDNYTKSSNLSSTLEKIYLWEKKLYKEVKDEERLRLSYYKECKRLNKLDDRGAETSKIASTHDSIRRVLPKINVAVSSVTAISKRIHKLRDEELQPQLKELLRGFMSIWKFLVECHRRQFKAIMETKACVEMANTSMHRSSILEATQKLEMEVLNWGTSFIDWINCQKEFIKLLNGWLLKCLLPEPEETTDGIAPFSPGRLGAPPIFIICSDWCNAIEKISETAVSKAIHDFASTLRQFWEKLDEERCQSLKVEYLSKDLEERVKYLCEDSGNNFNQYASANNEAASGDTAESGVPVVPEGVNEDLESLRNRLTEERARHEQVIRQVNDVASHSLCEGQVPIFEALKRFSLEMLKAYEQVRVPKEEAHSEQTAV